MWIWPTIIAQDDGGGEFFYIIAILLLSLFGYLADKIKQKYGESSEGQKPPITPIPPTSSGDSTTTPIPSVFRKERESQPPQPTSRPRPRPTARPEVRQRPPIQAPPRRQPPPPPPTRRPAMRKIEEARPAVVEIIQPPPDKARHKPKRPSTETAEPPITQKTKTPSDEKSPEILVDIVEEFEDLGSFQNLSSNDLRRAIVLNEILGPCIALREDDRYGGQ